MSWLLTIAGVAALIVLHELGHFAAAKLLGMRVERFSLFFPPTVARFRYRGSEYAIGAVPLGGYVKIAGMSAEELKQVDLRLAAGVYYTQPPWRRIAVILAGPAVNLAVAFLLFWVVLLNGNLSGAATLEALNPSTRTRSATPSVYAVQPGMPADGVLRPGDRIVRVDGRRVGVADVIKLIAAHRCAGAQRQGCRAAQPVSLVLEHAQQRRTVTVYPRYDAASQRMVIGFDFLQGGVASGGALDAAGTVAAEMWGITHQTLRGLGRAFTSEHARRQVSSIVGVTQTAQQTVAAGSGYALVFFGFISLVLAVMNMLPFLPLDGGHIVWSLAEKLRGRRIPIATMWRFSSLGILALAFLLVNGLHNDIVRLAG